MSMPDIVASDLDSAGYEGRSIVERITQLEMELKLRDLVAREGSPEHLLNVQFTGNHSRLIELAKDGLTGVEATLQLMNAFRLSTSQSREGLRRFSLSNTVISDTCPRQTPCLPTKFPSADGTCNNLQNPLWGSTFRPFTRLLPPRYADGINEPRASSDGGPLPSAREVSQRVTNTMAKTSAKVTSAFAVWAHFLAYDISLTGVTEAASGKGIVCCHPEIEKERRLSHPACLPIHVPFEDPFAKRFNSNCMHFLRSAASPRSDCTFGPREQMNQVTAYIDGSSIYGSSEQRMKDLRSFEGGKLNSLMLRGKEMLPDSRSVPCMSKQASCFKTGDARSNVDVRLTLLQSVMLREHNRLAGLLARSNPGWSDEVLFNEARKILIATIQHITYNEFLPLLLGKKVMSSYGLSPKLSGYSFDYDSETNADTINAFSTAANRYGHSLVKDTIEMYSSYDDKNVSKMSSEYDPSILYSKGSFDAIINGLLQQKAQVIDVYVSELLREDLFGGLDLVALTIQRGRDHGLAGYNEWRQYCGLPRIRDFEELTSIMDPQTARSFSRLYGHVDDIDLYPAGLAENHLPDGLLGPTFACIVAEQFRRLKVGDRFWYENGGMESSLSEAQLTEIRRTTFSRLLCDNSAIESIQLVSFVKSATWNPSEDCKSREIPSMNLNMWKNEPVWSR